MSLDHQIETIHALHSLYQRCQTEQCPRAAQEYIIEYSWRVREYIKEHGSHPFWSELR